MAATGLTHYNEVHIARLGDLFKERYTIIHHTFIQVARQIIRPELITDVPGTVTQALNSNVCAFS